MVSCCGCRLRIEPRLFKDKAKLRIKEKQKEKMMQKAQMTIYCMHNGSPEG
jgi:hypothetical protein